MVSNYSRFVIISSITCLLLCSSVTNMAFATNANDISILYKTANDHLMNGELQEAIELYDQILEISPENINVLLMKGVALSNLERHKQSILTFYKVLQSDPKNISALVGMGIGFGNFGEYKVANSYFMNAYELSPSNHVILNYKEFSEKILKKYPYNEVEKPEVFEIVIAESIPLWVKNTAGWWANGQIDDSEFITALQFLIKNKIIKIDLVQTHEEKLETIPDWVKNTANWWAENKIHDDEFISGIHFLIKNGILVIDMAEILQLSEDERKISDRNHWEFSRYIDRIIKTVNDDKRYIEYPNPSGDVIKKFLRDYAKWNFEQQIEIGNKSFPNPEYVLTDGTYYLEYKVYVNDQPIGLPLDHVSTLINSFKYWEGREFNANDGKPIKINFVFQVVYIVY